MTEAAEGGSRAPSLQPHPYALLLPALTPEEYAALKADIEVNGILYPVIVDEDGLVLDGVHRIRIADQLGIKPPMSQMGHLDDDGKLHLAVGLNMRRRHLDGDRRRELVRRLHTEEGLSVRKLAAITGWSKSTVDRDLKTSPFEEIIREAHDAAESVRSETSEIGKSIADALDGFGAMFGWADSQWKRGTWPPPPDEHFEMTLAFFDFAVTFAAIHELAEADSPDQRKRVRERRGQQHDDIEGLRWKWNHWTPERRRDFAENKRHLLRPRLSDTYDKED